MCLADCTVTYVCMYVHVYFEETFSDNDVHMYVRT